MKQKDRTKKKDCTKEKDQSDSAPPVDSGLVNGQGYFVEPKLFHSELIKYEKRIPLKEKPTCDSSFAAIERANSRLNHGCAVTGVVAAIDSRHGFVLPNAIADLQKGER